MPSIGVTRVAEVTQLDRVGIPNFMSVRPRDQGPGISYYNGKGITKSAAKAGAMMEAIEHYSGEHCDLPVFYATYREMKMRGTAVDPNELLVPQVREYRPSLRIEWIEGFDLISRRSTYVPLNAVVCPYEAQRGAPLYYASTNGLASGNTIEEALCHALCEVIERDALAIALTYLELAPAITRVLADAGLTSTNMRATNTDHFPLISLDDLPRNAAILVRKLRQAGLRVYLRNITSTGGIPTLDCTITEGRHLVHGGSGTHPDARVALTRALSEAAQSRVACIQGGREDLPEVMRSNPNLDPEEVFGRGPVRPFASIRSYQHDSVDADVRFILSRLKSAGFSQVVAIDLTRSNIAVPVVRVVIPKAEAWTVFHLHTQRGPFGSRVAKVLTNAGGRRPRTMATRWRAS
jgi:ribosomal protein S12 methylthiotransferase accessory factor